MAPKVHLDVRLTDEQNVTYAVTFQRASTLANVGLEKIETAIGNAEPPYRATNAADPDHKARRHRAL
jgi:hypothetical protein